MPFSWARVPVRGSSSPHSLPGLGDSGGVCVCALPVVSCFCFMRMSHPLCYSRTALTMTVTVSVCVSIPLDSFMKQWRRSIFGCLQVPSLFVH